MTSKITAAVDALITAAFIEGGVSPEKVQQAHELTDQRKSELMAAIGAPCLHQIAEPAAAPFMYAIADGYGNAFFEEQGCVSSEAKDLQPEVDSLNRNLDGEPPYRVVALYTHHEKSTPAQANHIADAGNMVSPTVLPEPALYVSGGQLENHCDPVDDSGRYIPARKTAAGLFSAALYTEQQVRQLLADHGIQVKRT